MVSVVRRMNEVTLRRAGLVLRGATGSGSIFLARNAKQLGLTADLSVRGMYPKTANNTCHTRVRPWVG